MRSPRSVVWGTRALGETLPAPDAVAVLHGEQGVVRGVVVLAVVVAAEATGLAGPDLKKELLVVAVLVDGIEQDRMVASLEALA